METLTKIVRWFAGFFEDSDGKTSRKGLVTYVAVALLCFMVVKQANNTVYKPDEMLVFSVVGISIFGIGAMSKNKLGEIFTLKANGDVKKDA
jgi:hypothetical protein